MTLNRVGSWDFFGDVVEAGFHEKALRMVAEGEVDDAAIDCHVLGVMLRKEPALAEKLRVIETLGPAPSQPVVVRAGLEANAKAQIQETLLGLHSPVMRKFGVEGTGAGLLIDRLCGRPGARLQMIGGSRKSPTPTLGFLVHIPGGSKCLLYVLQRSSQRCSSSLAGTWLRR